MKLAKPSKTQVIVAVIITIMLAGSSFAAYWFLARDPMISYAVDSGSTCAWKDGSITNTSKDVSLEGLPEKQIKQSEEATYIANAARNQQCVYRKN